MKTSLTIAAVIAGALFGAAPAAASPGNGIRLGGSEGRLHPYVELETRYDSNVFLVQDTPQGDMVLHFRPGVRLDVPGDPVDVNFDGALDWAQYLGIEGTTTGLSRMYGFADVGARVNKNGTLSLDAEDAFHRTNLTPSLSLDAAVITNFNTLRASMPWSPGGGAMILTTTGEWVLEAFEPFYTTGCDPSIAACNASTLAKLGYNELRAGEEFRWKFLPRTSALFDAGFFDRLPNSLQYSVSIYGLRLDAGATGLVTTHVGATVKGGYGDTFGSAGKTYRTWLATLEGEWIGNEEIGAKAGLVHDYGVDPGTQYALFTTSRVYAEGHLSMAGRALFKLRADWERRDYVSGVPAPTDPNQLSPGGSTDIVRIEPSVEGEVARWMKLRFAYAFTTRSSSIQPLTPGQTVIVPAAFEFTKHEVWLSAAFTY